MIIFLWYKIYLYRFIKKSICLNLILINKFYSNDVDEFFRLIVKEGDLTIVDFGILYDVFIFGGRIGVFVYN